MAAPKIKLNNGELIPALGLGSWRSSPCEIKDSIKHAIDVGYRHIDTARLYENETQIGEALEEKICRGAVKREDLFVTNKLWCNAMRPDLVEPTLRQSLKELRLSYLDLYLIHWPTSFLEGGKFYPEDENGKVIFSDVDYIDTWKAMEEVYKKGLVKSIGVSNFNTKQIKRLLDNATIKPVINQVECHVYLNQKNLISFCKSVDIVVVGFSPLGSNGRPWAKETDPVIIKDPKIIEIAQKYGKTPAQVALRFLVQEGVIPIPKSVNKKRIKENISIFDFQLSATEMTEIEKLNKNLRYHPHEQIIGHKNFPFDED